MQVGRDTVVSVRMELYDAQGALLEAAQDPITYVHGGYGGLPAPLEHALEGKSPGEQVRLQLEPEQAFGEYDAQLVRVEDAERYGEGLEVGMQVEEDERLYTVTEVGAGKVVLDANHPLAGLALRFFMEVLTVRTARPEEIAQGVSLP